MLQQNSFTTEEQGGYVYDKYRKHIDLPSDSLHTVGVKANQLLSSQSVWFYLTEQSPGLPVLSLTDGANVSSFTALTPSGC